MPHRNEDKPPERPVRTENVYEQINLIARPERNEEERYQDPITRNITLSNFRDLDVDIIMDAHSLHGLCLSQGALLNESAEFVDSFMQQYANARRGIGGLTAEMITTYTVKQTIKKSVTGEQKKPLLGSKKED